MKNEDILMIKQFQPSLQVKITTQEQQIYCRMLQRHRRYISEKNNFTKRLNSHIFQSRHRPKSKFYDYNREKMFNNTLMNSSAVEGAIFSLSQLERIPANQFFQLCLNLGIMTIKEQDKRQNIDRLQNDKISYNRSVDEIRLNQQCADTPKNCSLQKDVENLLQKLHKESNITNKQLFYLFMKKKKEARKISAIKKQIEVQIEQQNSLKRRDMKKI